MPAFDPVRDAVLNSPIDHHPNHSHIVASPLASPSLTRRATDLSVLLNSEPGTLPSGRHGMPPSSLSNILSSQSEDKLTASEPLIRRYSNSSSRSTQIAYPSPGIQGSPSPTRFNHTYHSEQQNTQQRPGPPARERSPSRPSSSSSTTTSNQRLPGGSGLRHTTSPSMPPPPTAPLPSSSHAVSTGPPAAKPPSRIPYRPTKRFTPAGSVLIPLSAQEMETFRNYRGQGSLRLTGKRKRGADDEEDETERRAAKRHAADVQVVVEHCMWPLYHIHTYSHLTHLCFVDNSRPDVGVVQRQESPIIGLKNFNNWVKSVLITKFAHPALQESPVGGGGRGGGGRGKVLDMGCGKGGDMTKWAKAQIRELFCVGTLPLLLQFSHSLQQLICNT